jgi:hypothetical protein
MPFVFIGVVLLILGVIFLRKGIKSQDKEGIIGATGVLIGAVVLIVFFGILYSTLVP